MSFEEVTHKTRDKFMSVATSYLRKIETDNQEEDFNRALDMKFKDITSKLEQLNQTVIEKSRQANRNLSEYEQKVKERTSDNDNVLDSLNKTIKFLTKGLVSLFFVIALISLVMLVVGPIGNYFGISKMYDLINHVIKSGNSPWRYLMLILYVVPYALLGLIIYGILSAYDSLKWR
ncbi:hypothetical protein ACEE96_12340 [Staphylococcus simulans]